LFLCLKKILQYSLREKTVQVVTKAANYVLQPGQSYEGTWHVEGFSHEQIIASGIYYYSTSKHMTGPGLAFRRERTKQDRKHYDKKMCIELGVVETIPGRCIAFPNSLQHKVQTLTNTSSSEIAQRKIFCFFLVDPNSPIVSSLTVPQQQWEWVSKRIIFHLEAVLSSLKLSFPMDVIKILLEYAAYGLTLKQAKEHRLALMDERKADILSTNDNWERALVIKKKKKKFDGGYRPYRFYAFCEH